MADITTKTAAIQKHFDKTTRDPAFKTALLAVQSEDRTLDFRAVYGEGVTPESAFFIASVTKMYHGTLAMQLVDAGRLDLDAPISQYLDAELLRGLHVYQGTDYTPQIKVHHLLHQTSGLPDYFEGRPTDGSPAYFDRLKAGEDLPYDLRQALDAARKMPAAFPPGDRGHTRAFYSDTNFRVLGAILEAITGTPIQQLYHERIFQPLGLAHTRVYDPSTGPQPLPFYYADKRLDIPQAMSSMQVDGAIVSTLDDVLAFLRAYFAGELFSTDRFARMTAQWNGVLFPIAAMSPIQYGGALERLSSPVRLPFVKTPTLLGHLGASGVAVGREVNSGVYVVAVLNQTTKQAAPLTLMLNAAGAAG